MEALDVYPWLLAPAIFAARVLDVSLGTFRTIVVFRGYPAVAAAIGFIEILIWVAASGQVLRQISAWPLMVAYAGGFACGNYVGIWLESKIAMGRQLLRIISRREDDRLSEQARRLGHEVVSTECEIDGYHGQILLVTAGRRQIEMLLESLRAIDPGADYTISDVKSLRNAEAIVPRRWPLVPSGWRVRGKRK